MNDQYGFTFLLYSMYESEVGNSMFLSVKQWHISFILYILFILHETRALKRKNSPNAES